MSRNCTGTVSHWVGVVRAVYSLSVLALLVGACGQTPSAQATRSLQGSGDVSFVCASVAPGAQLLGRPREACPDLDKYDPDENEQRELFALLTQPETGEVAVLTVGRCLNGTTCLAKALDLEKTQPGVNFLPVGGEPTNIVSTPGGLASFVGVAEPGREGIYGLPTRCIGQRQQDESFRDLRTWPACRLPSAPGVMEIVMDTQRDTTCGGEDIDVDTEAECGVDLTEELFVGGRHKLLVALPEEGKIAVIDAQQLLNAPPGSFDACPIDAVLELKVDRPETLPLPVLPDIEEAAECALAPPSLGAEVAVPPRPSDFSLSEGQLFISDQAAPVIHVVDISDPCALIETAPLLPASYDRPDLLVTTRKVAASPRTYGGRRFLYAVDGTPGTLAGSIMVFDLTGGVPQGVAERMPLVREHSRQIAAEPPDRIRFDQEVSDVEFAKQDFPEADPVTGVAVEGIECNPDPGESDSLGALYRPSDDNTGPQPAKLRGTFAFAALHSGLVTTIDVEDLDAPCRRPTSVNAGEEPDKYGCRLDHFSALEDGQLTHRQDPTVTNEQSCGIVLPHRPRAARLFAREGSGAAAPTLRSLPRLSSSDGKSLAVDGTDRGVGNPRMLAVNTTPEEIGPDGLSSGDAEVYVSGILHENQLDATNRLELDPALSETNSVLLPYLEPRAYRADMTFLATYEGAVRGRTTAPYRVATPAELGLERTQELQAQEYGVLEGASDGRFCSSGIEDASLMRERGLRLLPEDSAADELDQFVAQHTDFVNIASELLDQDHAYWSTREGRQCGEVFREPGDSLSGREICDLFFGSADLENFNRELRIVAAYDDRLLVEPRHDRHPRHVALEMIGCCFPDLVDYRVRAGNHWVVRAGGTLEHAVTVEPDTLKCVSDCRPIAAGRNGRVFELTCEDPEGGDACLSPATGKRAVGSADLGEGQVAGARALACVLEQHPEGGVQPGGPGSECVYDSLTSRFAIYRGTAPTERDMQFAWSTAGGFAPQSIDLLAVAQRNGASTIPQKITYLPEIHRLAVVDGGNTAMVLIGLKTDSGLPGARGTVAF